MDWLEAFCSHLQSQVRRLQPSQLVSILNALAALDHQPELQLMESMLTVCQYFFPFMDAAAFPTLAQSLVRLKVALLNGPWLGDFCKAVQSRIPVMNGEQLSALVDGLAVYGYKPEPAWLQTAAARAEELAEAFTVAQLELFLSGIVALGGDPPERLLSQFYTRTSGQLDQFSPDRLTAMVKALDSAGGQPDAEWLREWVATVRNALPSFNMVQLDAITKVLIKVDERLQVSWLSNFVAYLKEFFLYS